METLSLVTLPAGSLRQPSTDVDPETIGTPEFQAFCDAMVATMHAEDGIGLAAPQVGRNERVIVVNRPNGPEVFINAEIVKASDEKIPGEEGCLSVPGVWGIVERHKKITVRAQNRHGRRLTLSLKGFEAVIFQHEIDHTNGILFVDKATEITKGEDKLAKAL